MKKILTEFLQYIVIESLKNTPLFKLSPFLKEKIISCEAKPQIIKKIRSRNPLVEVDRCQELTQNVNVPQLRM